MGFDIECIIDIHSYPGEYFCPVCRTLVYPNEAFQAQCTHLYCKPCLVHIANGSKACPYDGYLVTESDSKPLAESDKALAEKVGKVKVHCLYFRSGCTWEGTLSDCPSHCAGCSFGNSPVICNRCGIQIIHRQVHDHAQICPGGYDGQQAVASASGVTRSATTSTAVTAVANQTVATSGAPVPQAQNPQNVSASQLPGQNANLQANANTQAPAFASAAMPAPDQWYQQQYQQYYQQYAGYDPYQQQQYYPPQQQQFQQYQQPAVQVQGQHQSHVYSQAVMPPQPQGQAQVQPQPHLQQLQPPQQTNPVSQAAQQSHLQPQVQGQAQPPPQPQLQMPPPQTQAQLAPQGQAQANAPGQALAPNYQVNPQQQPHPAMRPQTQIPPQALPPPPPQVHPSQPPQFPQAVGLRPPAQHPQAPQYQQGQGQMHHTQGSQAHLQPQMHPQTQGYVQSSSQSNVQSQSQAQHYQSQPQHPVFHSQTNQPAAPAAPPQAPHPPHPPVSGHHSYQQPQTTQKMQPGAPQQNAVLPHPASGSMHPVQVYAQTLQQPTPIRPPQSHGSFSQQLPSAPLPLQNQVAGIPHAPHQQFLPHGQQPAHLIQHRPVMQLVQQVPHNYAHHQQFSAPFQGQFHQHGHLPQQPPMQSQMQMRPPGPPQPQQSQNYPGISLMPNQGIPPQSHPLSSGASGHSGPAHGDSTQASINQNQNYAKPAALEQNATVKEIRSPKKEMAEEGFEGDSLKEEAGIGLNGTLVKDADNSAKDGSMKSVIKQEKSDFMGSTEHANEGKHIEAGGVENENHEEDVRTLSDSVPLKQADPENLMKLSKTAGPSSGNFGNENFSGISVSGAEGHVLPPAVSWFPPRKVSSTVAGAGFINIRGTRPRNFASCWTIN
ncbi:uncharacterized protein LOC130991994 [Salvia miltiorrhiza]|uniref:uncharacterized protein LOC130991994 n=1 Tax=Salvia miltiorrhiza TaxID=226208 RepID=UPI0025AD9193|nr:uncharacterized protein LOC130991994 [Salvia miltiorrhiza]